MKDVKECGKNNLARVDVLCGGFPCQDLSIAGRRQGIAGERSGLWFEFIRIIGELKPRFAVIENVPGLLSSNGGKDFAVIIQGLVKCGYGVAWRIIDSQFTGVAQRRRRVFIVGSLGSGSCAEILFERESVSWNPPTRRKTGQDVAFTLAASVRGNGDWHGNGLNSNYIANTLRGGSSDSKRGFNFDAEHGIVDVSRSLNAHGQRLDGESETFVTGTLNSSIGRGTGGAHESDFLVAKTLTTNYGKQIDSSDTNNGPPNLICATLNSGGNSGGFRTEPGEHIVAMPLLAEANSSHDESLETYIPFDERNITSWANRSNPQPGDPCHTLHSDSPKIAWNWQSGRQVRHAFSDKANLTANQIPAVGVRRLTPREAERLQGFEDDWTRWDAEGNEISDSARYRMLGNAVTVSVAKWIGRRMVQV